MSTVTDRHSDVPDGLPSTRVVVRTESGAVYRVDFEAWRLARVPGTVSSPDPEVAPSAHLRRDGQWLRILRVLRLEVGARAAFDVEPLGAINTLLTRRVTTIVESIVPDEGIPFQAAPNGEGAAGE